MGRVLDGIRLSGMLRSEIALSCAAPLQGQPVSRRSLTNRQQTVCQRCIVQIPVENVLCAAGLSRNKIFRAE